MLSIQPVSFGQVVAISGKPKKIDAINHKLRSSAKKDSVIIKDVTKHYKNAASSGVIAKSVQNGQQVSIYITGDDITKVKERDKGWCSIDGILSNLSSYYNLEDISISKALKNIFKR